MTLPLLTIHRRQKTPGGRFTYWTLPPGKEGQLLGLVQIDSDRAKRMVEWGQAVFAGES